MPADNSNSRTWFITGTSQGFGRELVRAALDRGDCVVATSRSPEKVRAAFADAGDRLHTAAMDLDNPTQIAATVDSAIQRFGRIDVLINNAGYGLLGALEGASDAEITRIFETNVFGLLRVTRAVLPHMRRERRGHIVNLSSIGGLVGLPGWGIYNATKFAIEGLSEALALEVAPLGIGVTIVEPGPFRTDFLGESLAMVEKRFPDYQQITEKTLNYQKENAGVQAGDPARGAKAIIDAVTSKNPPLHLLLGALAYQRATTKINSLSKEIETWRDVTLATDFQK
ncbi:MAG TPA: oxidoreductase [Phycisphaerae bacterium]|nr:oxidoreductase [Phycisphaerae bacterium]